jgi:hypothetical protein
MTFNDDGVLSVMAYSCLFVIAATGNITVLMYSHLQIVFPEQDEYIPYQPSTNIIPRAKALWMILVSRVDTGCDTERTIYYSLYISHMGRKI